MPLRDKGFVEESRILGTIFLWFVCLCLVIWGGGGYRKEQSCFKQLSLGFMSDGSGQGEDWLGVSLS